MLLPTTTDETAGIAAAAALIIAVAWKALLRLRSDSRGDAAESKAHSGFAAIIDQLRTEVARLTVAHADMAKHLDEITDELHKERHARYQAEALARMLQARVAHLEAELALLRPIVGQNSQGGEI